MAEPQVANHDPDRLAAIRERVRRIRAAFGVAVSQEATDLGHTCKVCQAPPIDRPAPYRHYGGQPCHGCQICLDDGEAGDGS